MSKQTITFETDDSTISTAKLYVFEEEAVMYPDGEPAKSKTPAQKNKLRKANSRKQRRKRR